MTSSDNDVDRYIITRKLINPNFSLLSILLNTQGFLFPKFAYPKYDVASEIF
jgi:hypothetical protein